MSRKRDLLNLVLLSVLIASLIPIAALPTPVAAQDAHRADAVVLANSTSAHYADFQHYLQPYLDNFGVPYDVLDVATAPVTAEAVDRALIIVGHNGLDEAGTYLDLTEQAAISAAVSAGAGLVNFDRMLADASYNPRYQYVQDVLGLSYGPNVTAGSIDIGEGGGGIFIDCTDDVHQDPVLTTTTDTADLVEDDDQWTEFLWPSRGYAAVFGGYDETLPLMHFFASGIPDGEYTLVAHLYWSHNLRYYWGYSSDNPEAYSIDVTSGNSGDFADYTLDTVTVSGGTFDLYVQNADPVTGGNDYPFFGWAWVRLVPEGQPPSDLHYITERHEPNESISVSSMPSLGMSAPADAQVIASAGGVPFLVVRDYGEGRAVQWGSYAWMSHSVKGPVYGLDDLVWRSLVWAARKPFVMQGMPPFLTMRVDDESGGFWWIEIANEFGIKPWAGLFFHNISDAEAADLSALVHAGQATTSIHAFNGGFFYFNHSGSDWPDDVMAAHFAEGTQWHEDHDIPISQFVLGHYYELGTNAFGGLSDWGVEFIGTQMNPGTGYGSPWIMNGPYRLYETGGSSSARPQFYGDFMTIPGHPEFDGQFFNCVTEIRDDAGYEWYPSNDVAGSIGRGTRQVKRAIDSMVLPTLFTHGQHVSGISQANWRAILQGITDNLAPYEPINVTMDYACQYVRATRTSDISHSEFDTHSGVLTTTLTGETDLATQFYLFTECGTEISEQRIDVPIFPGSTEVVTQLPGSLDHIEISPATVTLGFGEQQQFAAQGYDANDVPTSCADYTWEVVNGGGTIDQDGLFTAGTTPGTYSGTVTASDQGVTGTATVVVAEVPVDHFTFDTVGDQVMGVPFTVTLSARDVAGQVLTGYHGTADLSDSTGTIAPTSTTAFVDGVWSGQVTISQAASGVVISAQDGAASGDSNGFNVAEPPPVPAYLVSSDSYLQTAGVPFTVTVSMVEPAINLWEDDHQDPALETTTDPNDLDDTDGQWTEFHYVAGGRPYPSVMAGADEEDYGLPTMHFYTTDIPNGTYELIANLYTGGSGRDMRYYYGFTPADPKAHSVDTVGGTGGFDQHTEYSLGQVTVSNGRFDLYVRDADLLAGTYPFFGWAHLRLERVLPEEQFLCSDDAHQDPVLTTFTNPALLNDHDGNWDEFLYTSSRPYPTLLAGHNEWENNGLAPMHFFASSIPNGTYQVWANLYTVRDTRYYYGFSEAEVLAGSRWVDVAADTVGEQHTEYLLGTVEITDGNFDLWAGDGDILSGTPYFYGWAWIRLLGSGMTMNSSSPTMLFDGDGNGTFGEAGDDLGMLVDGAFDIAARDTTAGSSVVISATDSLGGWGAASYTILPGALAGAAVDPPEATLPPYGQQQFTAVGVDAWDNPIEGLDFAWEVVNGGGTIDASGLFTAGFDPGTYPDTVVATTGAFSDTATVTVDLVPANYFEFETIYEPQYAGVPVEVLITALDYGGNPVTGYNGMPALSDTTGTVSPANVGPFTDGVWQGYITVGAAAADVALTVDDGSGASGDSNPFDVLPMLEHIYSVTSDGYVQVVDSPFQVTVAPISHTINLWEDPHQRPVLATTTDPNDLDDTDGEWTEFHYVSGGRPYPSVMASVDEEDYGLPTMHFYAVGIPNGTYELFANLYTGGSGRDMRYYYGFTPADPKAHSVDTVGGTGGFDQHTEYSLGQVTVSNGRFDLYVRDADLLAGTYPVFGWAHLRLEPVFSDTQVTMSSGSPTLQFDGDDDGTFGEAGDDVHPMTGQPFTTWAVDSTPASGVIISATDDLGGTGVASYDILALDHIVVTPATATLDANQMQQFTAQGYTAIGDPIAGLDFAWSVANGGGTIDQNGRFTAGTAAGDYPDTVVAEVAGLRGTASVTVNAGAAVALEWAPLTGPQYAGVPFPVELFALDEYGNVASGYSGAVGLSDTTGTVAPGSVTLVDGRWSGDLRIDAVADDVVVSASDGIFSDDTDPFDVLPTPRSYIVSSDSYLQTAGEPFTVTVTAVSSTLMLADDNHQRPVLETFTDPLLFDYTDGEWDEFLWVGHRDYAGVFGGITEALSETLEPMHFYGAVPNGTYRVVANLYRSNDYRYFYGFEPGDMRAHSVDVTSGPSGDFAEFELGTVTITDHRFDLYTDHAEVLLDRGAFPAFGWAWIRLEPVLPGERIDLWEDANQDPVLATTTSVPVLLAQDGEWTEFLYTPSRPYPSVMAGHDEWENNGLQPMHFFAEGIPDGVYELRAGLYSAAPYHTRYYYGFSEAEVLAGARWVDNVPGAGGTEQHAEYSLGTVEISGGRFDLWAGDGDRLDSTAPYVYGWAWVRLLATGMDMSSSSPTMLFDGDGNGTFGEAGDAVGVLVNGTFDIAARETTAGAGIVITATDVAGNWGAATYTVRPGALASIELSPASMAIAAGETQAYTVEAFDAYGNSLGDATASAAFSIVESGHGGSWTDNVYTAHTAGTWTVQASFGGFSDDAELVVQPAELDAIVLSPATATITAGETQVYTAEAFDAYGNSRGDVTASTSFGIVESGHGGSWADNVYTAHTADTWTVRGTFGGVSGDAELIVEAAELDTIVVSPATATIGAGGTQAYTAEAFDAYGNSRGDVTAGTTFSIVESGHGGSWADNVYTAHTAGTWTVRGSYGGFTDDAELTVVATDVDRIVVSPASATIAAGEVQTYTVEVFDAYGNSLGDVTAETTFTVLESGHGGSWTDNVYTAHTMGAWTVQANHLGFFDQAQLTVEHGPAVALHVTPQETTLFVGESVIFEVMAEDACGNTWDVSLNTLFGIEPEAGGAWVGNVYTAQVPGDWEITLSCDGCVTTTLIHVELHQLYLPLVLNNHIGAPDLVVQELTVTESDVQVVLLNQGTIAVDQEFWVDVYIDPDPLPTRVNQIWNDLCDEGLVWGVQAWSLPLEPGETLRLSVGDVNYSHEHSGFSGLIPGDAAVYAQVDSANTEAAYGAVLEIDEITASAYNNIAGPAYVERVSSTARIE